MPDDPTRAAKDRSEGKRTIRTEARVERGRGRGRRDDRLHVSAPDPAAMFAGVGRLAYAWTQANTQLALGATQVLGNLVTDANRAVFRGLGVEPSRGGRLEHDDIDDGPDTTDDDERGFEVSARSSQRRGGRAEMHAEYRGGGRRVATNFAQTVNRAMRDTAEIIAESADRFAAAYEGDDFEGDDDVDMRNAEGNETEIRGSRSKDEGESETSVSFKRSKSGSTTPGSTP